MAGLGMCDVESSGSTARVGEVRNGSDVPVSTTTWQLGGKTTSREIWWRNRVGLLPRLQ